jgi:hypothetical protein
MTAGRRTPDNFRAAGPMLAHRTRPPTSDGAQGDARAASATSRADLSHAWKTFATLDRLERHEGHLLSCTTPARSSRCCPLRPTVDSEPGGRARSRCQGLKGLADGANGPPGRAQRRGGSPERRTRRRAARARAAKRRPRGAAPRGAPAARGQVRLEAAPPRTAREPAAALRWAAPEAGPARRRRRRCTSRRAISRATSARRSLRPIGEPDSELRSRLLALAARRGRSSRRWTSLPLRREAPAVRDRYRLADAEGAGRSTSHSDLLARGRASPAPRDAGRGAAGHWFHLGRPLASVDGAPVRSSGRDRFQYLTPLLLMRRYAGTLLDRSCIPGAPPGAVAASRKVPWGISGRRSRSSTARASTSTRPWRAGLG